MRKLAVASFLTLLAGSSAALAGGNCRGNCYQHVNHPPVYGTVAETVQVRPAQTYARQVAPVYGSVHETIVVQPEHRVQRVIPAQYSVVAENVMVSPARKVWQVTRDGWGREIGCWVTVPAHYGVRHRHVQVSEERVIYDTIPAVYGSRERTVLVKPGYVTHQTIPAEYATRHRHVQVAPGYSGWQPLR